MINPFKAVLGGMKATYRKLDNVLSKERDEELGEATRAVTLKAMETVTDALPALVEVAKKELPAIASAVPALAEMVKNGGFGIEVRFKKLDS